MTSQAEPRLPWPCVVARASTCLRVYMRACALFFFKPSCEVESRNPCLDDVRLSFLFFCSISLSLSLSFPPPSVPLPLPLPRHIPPHEALPSGLLASRRAPAASSASSTAAGRISWGAVCAGPTGLHGLHGHRAIATLPQVSLRTRSCNASTS